MERILIFALIGLGAQLVDGTLGMAFGVTATTLFVLSGTGAATASAVVHVAEIGTTLASGLSHWRFGNVDWLRVAQLGVPGAVSAFVGASFLSSLQVDVAVPVTSSILLTLGLWVVMKFAFLNGVKRADDDSQRLGAGKLIGLGVIGGLLDSTGGGGWGPVTTSALMTAESREPRKVIGTVSAAEFLVAGAAVAGFFPMLKQEFHAHTAPVVGLLVGGVLAAPLAAYLVGRLNPRFLGIVIGGILVALNLRTLCADLLPSWALSLLLLSWLCVVLGLLIWARSHDQLPWHRRRVELGVGAGHECTPVA
ncbi:sulfite exporter TauE/SafE family protein [Corynebacterium sp. H113]|uniref:sulfite exporter TauE/SafE family protein n=1 Tax=Corynebacterium sp. H113 TaxID=3133419 RepID=UPI00309753E7